VPVWVSGTTNRAAMRRLARFGTGWIPWGPDAADLPAGISRMRAAVAEHDRDSATIEVVGSMPTVHRSDGAIDFAATVASVPGLVEAGVTDFRSNFRLGDDPAQADQLASLVEAFRSVTR